MNFDPPPAKAPPIGAGRLMKLAFDGTDLLPLRLTLMDSYIFDPKNADALMDLALVEQIFGNREAGLVLQAEALAQCRLYRSPASARPTGLRLLAFAAAGDIGANTPLELLLEDADVELHTFYVVPGLPLPDPLPAHDVAIVAAGEADERRAALIEIAALAAAWPRPVINRPERIVQLGRERLFEVLRPVAGLAMPETVRLDRAALRRLGDGSLTPGSILDGAAFPVIARPVDSHAGHGLAKLDDGMAVTAYLAERREAEFHLSPFIDYRSADGLYRKYRIAFIDGEPFPCHMALSEAWQIWYVNAGMDKSAEKRAEEAHFLTDFTEDFGRRHAATLAAIVERVGLDYFGIDCAEMPDGRLLVFEADVAQVVHNMDPPDLFPYKGPAMRKLFAAFRAMLGRHAALPARPGG